MRVFDPGPAVVLVAAAASVAGAEEAKLPALTVAEVNARLAEKGFYTFDCNPRDVYDRGHVPQAQWVRYDALTVEDLPKDKRATLVFYCASER